MKPFMFKTTDLTWIKDKSLNFMSMYGLSPFLELAPGNLISHNWKKERTCPLK